MCTGHRPTRHCGILDEDFTYTTSCVVLARMQLNVAVVSLQDPAAYPLYGPKKTNYEESRQPREAWALTFRGAGTEGATKGPKKKDIRNHANPEGNGPQHSQERGRPKAKQRQQHHHCPHKLPTQ